MLGEQEKLTVSSDGRVATATVYSCCWLQAHCIKGFRKGHGGQLNYQDGFADAEVAWSADDFVDDYVEHMAAQGHYQPQESGQSTWVAELAAEQGFAGIGAGAMGYLVHGIACLKVALPASGRAAMGPEQQKQLQLQPQPPKSSSNQTQQQLAKKKIGGSGLSSTADAVVVKPNKNLAQRLALAIYMARSSAEDALAAREQQQQEEEEEEQAAAAASAGASIEGGKEVEVGVAENAGEHDTPRQPDADADDAAASSACCIVM